MMWVVILRWHLLLCMLNIYYLMASHPFQNIKRIYVFFIFIFGMIYLNNLYSSIQLTFMILYFGFNFYFIAVVFKNVSLNLENFGFFVSYCTRTSLYIWVYKKLCSFPYICNYICSKYSPLTYMSNIRYNSKI